MVSQALYEPAPFFRNKIIYFQIELFKNCIEQATKKAFVI